MLLFSRFKSSNLEYIKHEIEQPRTRRVAWAVIDSTKICYSSSRLHQNITSVLRVVYVKATAILNTKLQGEKKKPTVKLPQWTHRLSISSLHFGHNSEGRWSCQKDFSRCQEQNPKLKLGGFSYSGNCVCLARMRRSRERLPILTGKDLSSLFSGIQKIQSHELSHSIRIPMYNAPLPDCDLRRGCGCGSNSNRIREHSIPADQHSRRPADYACTTEGVIAIDRMLAIVQQQNLTNKTTTLGTRIDIDSSDAEVCLQPLNLIFDFPWWIALLGQVLGVLARRRKDCMRY